MFKKVKLNHTKNLLSILNLLKQTLFIQQKDEKNKSRYQLKVNDKTAEFKPISPESLDVNCISPVKETSKSREHQETRDKTVDGSYVEVIAKILDF